MSQEFAGMRSKLAAALASAAAMIAVVVLERNTFECASVAVLVSQHSLGV
jgi:hypothetical protein